MDPEIVDALVRAGKWDALTRYVESVRESAEAENKPPKYYYTCWKCNKKMWEDSEDESTRIEEAYLRGYAVSMNYVRKNFYYSFHDRSCGSNDCTIGCCTCDGKTYYTIATCFDHSQELIKYVHDTKVKKPDWSTFDIVDAMRIEDCRKRE